MTFHVPFSSRSDIKFQVLHVQGICLFHLIHTARMTEGQSFKLKWGRPRDRQSFWGLWTPGQSNPRDLVFPKRCLQEQLSALQSKGKLNPFAEDDPTQGSTWNPAGLEVWRQPWGPSRAPQRSLAPKAAPGRFEHLPCASFFLQESVQGSVWVRAWYTVSIK